MQAGKWAGIRIAIAASFAPIHAANNINQGVLMGGYDLLQRLEGGEGVPLEEFYRHLDPISQLVVQQGGLFAFAGALAAGEIEIPEPATQARPMTMAEKILASKARGDVSHVRPGDSLVVDVDGGYSHDYTTAQVHYFLQQEYGSDYRLPNPERFAVFEDHLIYADSVAKMAPFSDKIERLRQLQRGL